MLTKPGFGHEVKFCTDNNYSNEKGYYEKENYMEYDLSRL